MEQFKEHLTTFTRNLQDSSTSLGRYSSVQTRYGDENDEIVFGLYTGIAVFLFVFLALQLLFPVNPIVPIDRRTSSILCASLVYVTHKFLLTNFPEISLVEAIDWDVLLLLTSIMIVNYIFVRLRETKEVLTHLQNLVRDKPAEGFWMVAWASFLVSPFLTNDGVCLLFVSPILECFSSIEESDESDTVSDENDAVIVEHGEAKDKKESSKTGIIMSSLANKQEIDLRKSDALYFMFALACSANIGSSLTYTGNPQNMIVASSSIGVLSPIKFLGYMILPALFSQIVTIKFIEWCWTSKRYTDDAASVNSNVSWWDCCPGLSLVAHYPTLLDGSRPRSDSIDTADSVSSKSSKSSKSGKKKPRHGGTPRGSTAATDSVNMPPQSPSLSMVACGVETELPDAFTPLSPAKLPTKKRASNKDANTVMSIDLDETTSETLFRYVSSPFPYLMLILMGVMIVMIFVDVMSISGLICTSAIVMVMTVVIGNHYQGSTVYEPVPEHEDENLKEKDKNEAEAERVRTLNGFFEDLFASIDYNLLFIFLGLFVVVENFSSTGIPRTLWSGIVGNDPFGNAQSVTGIMLFVAIASQFLGNVAVCQLAVPNVDDLDDDAKRYAWALISFVSTIAGNLLLTGSAANIIVAEQAARIDESSVMTFANHGKVCFAMCTICCIVGTLLITAANSLEMSFKA